MPTPPDTNLNSHQIEYMAQHELVLHRAHLPLPVYNHGHRTVTLQSHRDHIHCPGVPPRPPIVTVQIHHTTSLTPLHRGT